MHYLNRFKEDYYQNSLMMNSLSIKPGANESQKTRNKKQNGLAHSRFIVCVTPEQKKNIA